MGGAEVGEEDTIDRLGPESRALKEMGGQCRCGKAGVHENMMFVRANERGGRVRGADGLGFVPQAVAGERADADDVNAELWHGGSVFLSRQSSKPRNHKLQIRGNWKCGKWGSDDLPLVGAWV